MSYSERIVVAKPPIGAKCWVMDRKGRFLLEEGAGVLHHLTCTHAGEGAILARDLDGRHLIRLQPSAMGVWHLSGGFHHGLEIEHMGNAPHLGAIASVVWQARADNSTLAFPTRSTTVIPNGETVLCTSDAILYEVLITQGGAGEIEITDGTGRPLWNPVAVSRLIPARARVREIWDHRARAQPGGSRLLRDVPNSLTFARAWHCLRP